MKNLKMKTIKSALFIMMSLCISSVSAQEKELVIVGTMHGVPNIVKSSYKPMYKRAAKYNPERIFVEYAPGWDTMSVAFSYRKFNYISDSLSKENTIDQNLIDDILNKDLSKMTRADFKELITYFYIKKDLGNTKYYQYLAGYGVNGSKKPIQDENGDVSFRLAASKNMKMVTPVDYQYSNKYYYKYWSKCDSVSRADGSIKKLNKMIKKVTWASRFGVLFGGGLAKHTNKRKTYERYHKMNSFRYRDTPCSECEKGAYWWDFRNEKIADNVAREMAEGSSTKNLLVIGAGHIEGLKQIFENKYPNLKIKLLYELN